MATSRSDNSDLLYEIKKVGEVKFGYYADAECYDTPPRVPFALFGLNLTLEWLTIIIFNKLSRVNMVIIFLKNKCIEAETL